MYFILIQVFWYNCYLFIDILFIWLDLTLFDYILFDLTKVKIAHWHFWRKSSSVKKVIRRENYPKNETWHLPTLKLF